MTTSRNRDAKSHFDHSPAPSSRPLTLVELLRGRALNEPNHLAYIFLVDGDAEEQRLTYADLDLRARAIAAWLQSRGLEGERALLPFPPSLEFIAAYFGCLYAGVVAIPACPPSRNRGIPLLHGILKDARPKVVLTTATTKSFIQRRFGHAPEVETLHWQDVADIPHGLESEWRDPSATSGMLAFLQYTSGTTTHPKGVMLTHGNLMSNLRLIQDGFQMEADGNNMSVFWLPGFHDMGLVGAILEPMYIGSPALLMPPAAFVQRPVRWLAAITRYRATITGAPNFAYRLCVDKITPKERMALDLSSLRVAFCGAEPIHYNTLARFAKTFAPCGFREDAFYPCYGLAEATLMVSGGEGPGRLVLRTVDRSALRERRVIEASPETGDALTLVSSGRMPLDHKCVIVHPQTLTRCEPGEIGEIWVAGPSVSTGYWHMPEETERSFAARLADTGEGPFLRTGDLGFMHEGELYVTGRLKDLIIIRGINHFPQEIELSVEQCHPALVPDAGAAFSVDIAGQEQLVIVHEVGRSVRDPNVDDIAGAIQQAVVEAHDLQVYAVVLIKASTIPRTTSGKVKRYACSAGFLAETLQIVGEWRAPLPCDEGTEGANDITDMSQSAEADFAATCAVSDRQREIEAWLSSRLSGLLNLPLDEVDVRKPIAHYGFDSIRLVGLARDLESWLGRSLSPTLVWNYPTIEVLARHLAQETPAEIEHVQVESAKPNSSEPIAIIGLGCRFPSAKDPDAYWQLLRDGVDAISEIPPDRWLVDAYYDADPAAPGKMYARWGGFLDEVDKSDPYFFGISPREATGMDPQQWLLLEVAWEALENAAQSPDVLAGSQTGVFVGISTNDHALISLPYDPERVNSYSGTGNAFSVAAGRLSYQLDLRGPSLAVDTACSSSLVSVHLACQSLRAGECGLALAGGVNLILSPVWNIASCQARMMAFDGRCKTFDVAADGYVRGEGCGVVVLRRLADALANGDRILALIRGSAVNQDGRSSSLTAPNGLAQEAVIRRALANAGVGPAAIDYMEAHGTGTPLGDPIEMEAISKVLGERGRADRPLVVGSVKTNIGHLEAAAGIAGLIKVVLSLQHEEIPQHLHLKEVNPRISLEAMRATIPTHAMPWRSGGQRRIAGVSSFGFGGTNAHVVVEEAPPSAPVLASDDRPLHLLALSAKSEAALRKVARRVEAHLEAHPSQSPGDVCFTAITGRAHFNHRLAVIGDELTQFRERLAAFVAGESPAGVHNGRVTSGERSKIAFLFAGEGTQCVGMGRQLFESEPEFRAALNRCSAILRPSLEQSLLSVLYPEAGAPLSLDDAAHIQPALFALEYALAELWRSWGIMPSAVMGYGVGEYVAACIAGVFSLEDGLKLVADRGRLMKSLTSDGAMAAIFADPDAIANAIEVYDGRVVVAGFNGSTHTVVAGEREAVRAICLELEAGGLTTCPIDVSHAVHSPLMEPMLDAFEETARPRRFEVPRIPFVSSLTGTWLQPDQVPDACYWRRHLHMPVRFAAGVETLAEHGCRVFVEIGPSPALISMGKECLPDTRLTWLPSLKKGIDNWSVLLESLAALYVKGVRVDWTGFDRSYSRNRLALPTYPFERKRLGVKVDPNEERRKRRRAWQRKASHPLLDRHVQIAGAGTHIWEVELDGECLSYLKDYRLGGKPLVPGTLFAEMAQAAAAEALGPGERVVAELEFHRALFLQEGARPVLQLSLSAEANGDASISIYSRPPGEMWTLYAVGKVKDAATADAAEPPYPLSPESMRARCSKAIPGHEFYRQLRKWGFACGPSFEGIERLWRSEGEALAHISLPQALRAQAAEYQFHPALLDACLQVLGAAIPDSVVEDGKVGAFVPVRMDQIRLFGLPDRTLWSYARLRTRPDEIGDDIEGDVIVFDHAWQIIAHVRGLQLRRLDEELVRLTQAGASEWHYELQWQPRSLLSHTMAHPSPDYMPPLPQIAKRVQSRVMQLSCEHELHQYLELGPRLDGLAAAYVVKALRQLGLDFVPGERLSGHLKGERWSAVDKHRRLLGVMIEMLELGGVLVQVGDDWQVVRTPEWPDPETAREGILAQFPACQAELALLSRCGSGLSGVMRGEVEPLSLLFPDGSLALVEALYQDSPFARTYNLLIQEAVSTAIERLPQGRTVRILEIGAGTGGTTSCLLPNMPADRTEYVFTDLSNLFTTAAESKFRNYPFVRYSLLDIEQDVEAQGFGPHQFDVILAANVLHATSDLRRTLGNVKRLLASDGLLILLEATGKQPWLDLVFGLTKGWWKFTDFDLRPSHPLLSRRKWSDLLAEMGFAQLTCVPETEVANGREPEQTVILARGPGVEHEPTPVAVTAGQQCTWLVFADRGGVGQELAKIIQSSGGRSVVVLPGNAYQLHGEERFCIRPERPEDIQALLAEALPPDKPPLRRVVHLWSLDAVHSDAITTSSLEAAYTHAGASILHLVQALVPRRPQEQSPRLWLITSGVQQVGPHTTPAVGQAVAWGLGRTLRQEHPKLWGGLVDLDASDEAHMAARMLWEEINGSDGEDEIAFRAGQRFVARLFRPRESTRQRQPLKWRADRSYLITGGLGDLGVIIARWMIEQGARCLILVGRTELPPRAEWARIGPESPTSRQIAAVRELEALGASVRVASVDVADESQLAAFLDEHRRDGHPPIGGVIHLAAVLHDAMLTQTDVGALHAVMRPKAVGAWHLHRLLTEAPLDFFILFSSAASLFGQLGHGAYAAANSFLDALAHYRRVRGLPALSVNWGAWAGLGVATTAGGKRLVRQLATMGFESLPPARGLEALEQLMRLDATQAVVQPVNWRRFLQFFEAHRLPPLLSGFKRERDGGGTGADRRAEAGLTRDALLAAQPDERARLLEAHLREGVARVLGIPSSELNVDEPLDSLGIDSLMAIELENQLERELGAVLPMVAFLQGPSVAELAAQVIEQLAVAADSVSHVGQEPSPREGHGNAAMDVGGEDPEQLLARLDQLSNEEVDSLLRKYLSGAIEDKPE